MAEQPQDDSWRTPEFRRKVIAQLDDTISNSGNPMSKSSTQMENHVYQKAKSREEYLALVARLIIHVREFTTKKEQGQLGGQGGMVGAAGGQPQAGGMLADPMSALHSLTRTPNPNMQGGQIMQGQMMGAQMGQMQQRPPFQTYQQQPGGGMMPGQQAAGMPGQQGVMPGQQGMMPGQQMPGQQAAGGGMPGQPGMMPGQQMPGQQAAGGGMPGQPGMMRPRMAGMQGPQDQFLMQQQQQQLMQQQQQQQQQLIQQQQLQQQQQQMQQQQQQNMGIGGASGMGVRQPMVHQYNPGKPMPYQQQASGAGGPMMGNQANMTSGGAPSPASLPAPSYSTMPMLSSPGQMVVAPSPASKASASAPSPSTNLNTPGNMGGPAPSPQAAITNAEEQAYLDKLKQLRKYIEPLKRMVGRIEKEEERKNDLHKMKNLLGILSDSNKRLPFGTLLKCEQALEKLDFQWGKGPGSTPGPVTKTDQQHMCQPLIDAIAQHIQHPMLNHTLNRTFGPAIDALHGTPIRSGSPPLKRKRVEEEQPGKPVKIPNIVQGEVARLENRFRVRLDPRHPRGSTTIHLVCRLEDRKLPSVPPLYFSVPEDYPESSPTCDTTSDEYNATEFLEGVQKNLSSLLLNLPDKFSISALLDTWELSIRQMSAPNAGEKLMTSASDVTATRQPIATR